MPPIDPFIGTMVQTGTSLGMNFLNNRENRKEAEKSRQWSEDMYKKYYSPSAQRIQMRQAGFNPLANESQTAPLAMPSGSQGGSAGNPSLPDFGTALLQQSQAKVNNALAEKYEAETNNQQNENYVLDNMDGGEVAGKKYGTMRGYLKALEAHNLVSSSDLNAVQQNLGKSHIQLNDKTISKLSAEISSIKTKNDMMKFQQSLQSKYGIDPEDDGIKALVKIAVLHPEQAESIVRNLTKGLFGANVGFVKGVADNWKSIFDLFGSK